MSSLVFAAKAVCAMMSKGINFKQKVFMYSILKKFFARNTKNRFFWTFDRPIALIFCVFLVSCTKNNTRPNQVFTKPDMTPIKQQPLNDEILEQVAEMSLEQKVGQIFIFGVRGKEFNKEMHSKLTDLNAGSIIIFKRNMTRLKQIHKLNSDLQKAAIKNSGVPLFIMVDQEGGVVSRLKTRPTPPSALSMGETNDLSLIHEVGKSTGEALKSLGFNLNLAPVVDLSNPYKRNFAGNRSFGENPDDVYIKANSFAEGLLTQGVLPTFKHFPGHGGVVTDSHYATPIKHDDFDTLMRGHAKPFYELARSEMDSAIMTAHISFPKIEPSGVPATYSKKLLTDLLKKRFGYKGLIMTDDLEMSGAYSNLKIGERAVAAFNAGADMIMVAWTHQEQKRAFRYMVSAVKSGKVSASRLDESVYKILSLKQRYAKPPIALNEQRVLSQLKRLVLSSKKVSKINFNNSFKGPVSESFLSAKKYYVYSSSYKFFNAFKNIHSKPSRFIRLKKNTKINLSQLSGSNSSVGVYYVSGMGTARILNKLPSAIKRRLFVVNATYPGAIKNHDKFLGLAHLNQNFDESSAWLAKSMQKNKRLPANSVAKKRNALKDKGVRSTKTN